MQIPAVLKTARGAALTALNSPDWVVSRYNGTDKFDHGYLAYYRRVLGPRRFRSMTVFEIGVGEYENLAAGGSLQLWRDYFPRSTIVGLDIAEKKIDFGPRVYCEKADQSSQQDLQAVVQKHGRPNIVIDDGSHVGEHQVVTFSFMWSLMPSGSVYVIEDLATSYVPSYGGFDPPPGRSGIGLLQQLLTSVQTRDPVWINSQPGEVAPRSDFDDVASVLTFPGIAFIEKA